MRNEEYGFFAKRTLLHKIFGVEFGIASIAVNAAAKEQNGIGFAFFDEICGVVAAFKICGLSIENGNPFNVSYFIIFDKPMTAFFENGVCKDCNNKQNQQYDANAEVLFLLVALI